MKSPWQGVCATVVVPGPLDASTTMAMSYDCPEDQDVKGPRPREMHVFHHFSSFFPIFSMFLDAFRAAFGWFCMVFRCF